MGAGDISEVDLTPRRSRQAPERFTVDSYDGRSKDIRKYHRSETLVQNVDSLSLRNRTVLTPNPAEVCVCLSPCAYIPVLKVFVAGQPGFQFRWI